MVRLERDVYCYRLYTISNVQLHEIHMTQKKGKTIGHGSEPLTYPTETGTAKQMALPYKAYPIVEGQTKTLSKPLKSFENI